MKIINKLRKQDIEWIEANKIIFESRNHSINKQQIQELFGILSWLTAKNQKPTSCGRCIITARDTVYAAYKKC